jgi:2-polyprenyl-6-methoxyphenol hydroxylase-like FAD-dependent oxidoreductase
MQTQVLVVGAGPVGLTTAIGLVKAGIEVIIVDAAEAGKNGSRAAAIQANTLEVCLVLAKPSRLD